MESATIIAVQALVAGIAALRRVASEDEDREIARILSELGGRVAAAEVAESLDAITERHLARVRGGG